MPWLKPKFERISRFAPLVGVILGLIEGAVWLLFTHLGWQKETLGLITVALGIWLTGGIHFDGLMDTADGLGAGEDKCKEAMRDSRVGASGVQALCFILLIQLAALIKLNYLAPIAIPIATFWGRFAPLWAIGKFKYLHKNGSASFHKLHWKGIEETIPSLFIICISILYLSINLNYYDYYLQLIFCIVIGILPAIIIPDLLGRKLGGHSGDSYGATVVFVETFMLLIIAIIL